MEKYQSTLLAAVLWIPFLLFILCLGPGFILLILYRLLVTRILRKCLRPDLLDPVLGLDVGFSTDSFWTAPKGGIAFVHTLSGPVDPQLIQSRIHKIIDSKAGAYKRLTSVYPVFWLGYAFWKKVVEDGFRLEDHIRVLNSVHGVNRNEDMNTVVADWVRSPFKNGAPLWDVLLVSAGPRSLFGFRIHHMIGDGHSMLQFLNQLFDSSQQQPPIIASSQKYIKLNYDLVTKFKTMFWTPFVTAEFLKAFYYHSDYFTERKLCQRITLTSTSIALTDLKSVRLSLGMRLGINITFLTLVMHLVGSGLRKYLKQDLRLENVPHEVFIVASLPHMTQGHPEGTFCNHWTHGVIGVPIQPENSMKRLEQLQTTFNAQTKSQAENISYNFSNFCSLLPKFVVKSISGTNMGTPLGLANLPGPAITKYLGGQEIEKKYAVVGLQWEHSSIALGVFSYNGNVTITMMANMDVIPDLETGEKILNDYVHAELSELLQEEPDEQV